MAEPADRPNDDPARRVSAPGAPRWVKVFGLIVAVLVLLFAALHLAGLRPGGHGVHGAHAGAARAAP
jgi:hypothetical protein